MAVYMVMISIIIIFIGCDDNSTDLQGGDVITAPDYAWIYEQDSYGIAFMFDSKGTCEIWRYGEEQNTWTVNLHYEVDGNLLLFQQDRRDYHSDLLGVYTFPFFTYSTSGNTMTLNSHGTGSFVLTKKEFYADDFVTPSTELKDNYPNPFDNETTIVFDLHVARHLSLNVYNVKGQKIKTLIDEVYEVGRHAVVCKIEMTMTDSSLMDCIFMSCMRVISFKQKLCIYGIARFLIDG